MWQGKVLHYDNLLQYFSYCISTQVFWKKIFKFTAFIIYTSLIWAKNLEKILEPICWKSLTWHFVNMMEDKVHGGENCSWISEMIWSNKNIDESIIVLPVLWRRAGWSYRMLSCTAIPLLLKTEVLTLSTMDTHIFPCLIRIRYLGCDVQDYLRENKVSLVLIIHSLIS